MPIDTENEEGRVTEVTGSEMGASFKQTETEEEPENGTTEDFDLLYDDGAQPVELPVSQLEEVGVVVDDEAELGVYSTVVVGPAKHSSRLFQTLTWQTPQSRPQPLRSSPPSKDTKLERIWQIIRMCTAGVEISVSITNKKSAIIKKTSLIVYFLSFIINEIKR